MDISEKTVTLSAEEIELIKKRSEDGENAQNDNEQQQSTDTQSSSE